MFRGPKNLATFLPNFIYDARRLMAATMTAQKLAIRLRPTLLFMAVATLLSAQITDTPAPKADDQPFRYSAGVRLVVLQTTVLTPKGGFARGLRQPNFQVFEDSRPQTIKLFRHDDSAVAIGLIVDNSGSMRRKHAAVLAAAKAFTKNSNPKDELFIVNFNEKPILGLPETKLFSANSRELERALPATAAGGKTALFDALALGLSHIHGLKQDKKALILVSDGGDNASTHTAEQVIAEANDSDVVIYTIGLFNKDDDEANPAFMKQIASVTGGEAFLPARANQAATSCKRIAQTIRNEYSLGYSPNSEEAGAKFRTIRVTVQAPRRGKLIARTRTGYTQTP